jgi:uncharacterized membrane protein YhaH (DUF805 family)
MIAALRYLVTPWGRVSRRAYWTFGVISPLLLALALYQIWEASPEYAPVQWLVIALWACSAYVCVIFDIRRLHDRNRSGWWLLAYTVFGTAIDIIRDFGHPWSDIAWMISVIVSFAFIWELCVRRGTRGPNKYGPDPLAAATPNQDSPDTAVPVTH